MPLQSGSRLGPYEILSAIGAGGMGEVYRARDTRLDRTVAIKVLPAHMADNAEKRERFEREARTIASLNHPHICTLHDVGRQDGVDFLVMEYVEGETLTTRLLKGPLPLDQTLRYASEIADALDKAHRKGVTHRDLKPGNIMLTKNGAKLLDFGLAKLKQGVAPAPVSISHLPTLSQESTAEGTILGTLQYMAPEQVEGKIKEIDERTDIFAFGAVVYEMATGKKAFEGKTSASLIAKILETEPPPISSLQPMTPPALDRAVRKCLAKDPEERWQTARDVCDELKWIREGSGRTSTAQIATGPTTTGRTKGRQHWLGALAITGLVAVVIAAIVVLSLRPAPAPQPLITRSVFTLPAGDRLTGSLALSPDGRRLVYAARRGDTQQLFLHMMDSFGAMPLAGTERGDAPVFSPDSQWIAFVADGKLKKLPVGGGSVTTLGQLNFPGATSTTAWGRDDTIVFGSVVLSRISAAGGTAEEFIKPDATKGEIAVLWPTFLPRARGVLFNGIVGNGNFPLRLYDPKTQKQRELIANGMAAHYVITGHLIYVQSGTLMAVPFDLDKMETTGSAVPVVEGVMQSGLGARYSSYSISDSGSLAYSPGTTSGPQTLLVWVDRNGKEEPIPAPPSSTYVGPRISPDGKRVALGSQGQVWIYDLARETLSRLTFGATQVGNNAWTPDGKRLTFQAETPLNLFWVPADGSGQAERLATSRYRQGPGAWSPDGKDHAFVETNPQTKQDIWILHLADNKSEPFIKTPFNEGGPQFSPDGHWLAYASDQSGQWEVYVQPYPGPGGKVQISTDGGKEPLWNHNGKELFYRNGDKVMAVPVSLQPTFSAGKTELLFEGHYHLTNASLPQYDVSPDGQRFLMVKDAGADQSATQINIVQNWFQELEQKVPITKK